MSRRSTAFFKTLTALTVLVLLAGCSSLSPYSKVTKINLKLTGGDQLSGPQRAAVADRRASVRTQAPGDLRER